MAFRDGYLKISAPNDLPFVAFPQSPRSMFKSIRLLALPALLFSIPAHAAFDACLDQFPNRTPPTVSASAGQVRDLCMDSFAILHSGQSKTAVYVVERLNRVRLAEADEERTDRFYEEARLPSSHRARLADYKGSGRDRGHLLYPVKNIPNSQPRCS